MSSNPKNISPTWQTHFISLLFFSLLSAYPPPGPKTSITERQQSQGIPETTWYQARLLTRFIIGQVAAVCVRLFVEALRTSDWLDDRREGGRVTVARGVQQRVRRVDLDATHPASSLIPDNSTTVVAVVVVVVVISKYQIEFRTT